MKEIIYYLKENDIQYIKMTLPNEKELKESKELLDSLETIKEFEIKKEKIEMNQKVLSFISTGIKPKYEEIKNILIQENPKEIIIKPEPIKDDKIEYLLKEIKETIQKNQDIGTYFNPYRWYYYLFYPNHKELDEKIELLKKYSRNNYLKEENDEILFIYKKEKKRYKKYKEMEWNIKENIQIEIEIYEIFDFIKEMKETEYKILI